MEVASDDEDDEWVEELMLRKRKLFWKLYLAYMAASQQRISPLYSKRWDEEYLHTEH
jgi:hypothetical protein